MRNALHDLSALIASLHDAQGRIRVAEYMAAVPELTERQRADTAALPIDPDAFYGEMDGAAYGDPAYSIGERLTLRPTIDVNAMWGGYSGAGGKTVIPREAHAKLTMRLVPGQDPDQAAAAVCRHLQAACPPGVTLSFTPAAGSPAFSLEGGHPLLQAAEAVIMATTGRRPVYARAGSTIPITAIFKEMLGLDTLTFGYAMPDEDVHAPNEFFRLSSVAEGLRDWTLLLAELARYKPEDLRASRHPA